LNALVVSFEIFQRSGTRISEDASVGRNAAISLLIAFGMEDAQGSVRHAVDAPLGVTVLVADGDGEAAVIGAHQVDDLVAVVARQRQRRPFARVRRPVLALFTGGSGVAQCRQQAADEEEGQDPPTRTGGRHGNGMQLAPYE